MALDRRLIAVRAVSVLAAVSILDACSFATVSGPPVGHEQMRYFDCTDDNGAALGDIGGTAFTGIMTIAMADIRDDPGNNGSTTPLVIFGALTALYASSAIYGFVTADSCRSAEAAMSARLHESDRATQQRINDLERQLTAASAAPGCTADDECRADRVCEQGRCVSVPVPPAAPEAIIVVPEPSPEPASTDPPLPDEPTRRTGKPSYPN